MNESSFQAMADRWPSAFVARDEIERFSGGIIRRKYIQNLDCAGKGPRGRVRVGRRIAYPTAEVVRWLESRVTPLGTKCTGPRG